MENAQRYNTYALKFPTFRETSRDLVELADLSTGMVVMDLACGTGITTEALLEQVGETGRILAVDASPAMLEIARTRIHAANVTFLNSPAEQLGQVVGEKVDRVVCNAAFWQMKMEDALQAIARVLKPEGMFAFNIPGGFFRLDQSADQAGPSLLRLASDIAWQQYHYVPPALGRRPPFDFDTIAAILTTNGFAIRDHRILPYKSTQEDLYEFCRIPIMSWMLPGLDYATKMHVLAKAFTQVDKSRTTSSRWVYFLVQPT
jgi:ubiquinone/menaquinone biosynthesis C-methylase UbiE